MEQNWTRWIFASLASYLKQTITAQNWPVLVDQLDDRTDAFMQASDRAEIRITGPFFKQPSNGYWLGYTDANVLLTSRFEGALKNAYSMLTISGALEAAMDKPIPVFNYGGQSGDYVPGGSAKPTWIGALIPRLGQSVRVLNFGQISVTDREKQTEVEARYMIELYSQAAV